MSAAEAILAETTSLCPRCLRRLPARYVDAGDDTVLLVKECPEHGAFRVPVWRGPQLFRDWLRPPAYPSGARRAKPSGVRGCPFDCGLCGRHGQNTCCALLEVTERCSLACPVCYAAAADGDKPEPTLEELGRRLDALLRQSGVCNLQLSGGEPTERGDLPAVVALARGKGFTFIQLNTNGLRLGGDKGYAERLADAGLSTVYLQFDSLENSHLEQIRGRACLAEKREAVRAAMRAGLGVVLVMTLVPGVNQDQLGPVFRFALEQGPGIRGMHIQPAASFGRHPWKMEDNLRITLPEVMRGLAEQSGGWIALSDFHPPGSEHSLCSFNALYERSADGGIRLVRQAASCCCTPAEPRGDGARRARDFTALHWRGRGDGGAGNGDDFDRILRESGLDRRFTVSAMAFQDAMTVDLERLRGCHIHIVAPSGDVIPFCACNLTGADGRTPHRGMVL